MTLFTKKPDSSETLTRILASQYLSSERLDKIAEEQVKTNELLKELIKAVNRQAESYGSFINVIQNFFAIEKKLSIEESKRRAEREAEFDLTEADKKY